jgi:signal transduction histidine kinase
MAVFLANCVQFQWHAWRPRAGGRRVSHRLLALCWLVFVLVALNDLFSVLDRWEVARNWAALSGLLVIALVMLLLGGQLAQQMRKVERFSRALEEGVARARAELAQASAREHTRALENAKLQERMQLAHDLHDGLGAGLVRGMALLEQAREPLSNERTLSLLKSLRDDLRQVIDHGSSAGAAVPETPVQWAAPLRHRFTRILDEMEVPSEWRIATQWQGTLEEGGRPSALQCLLLTRLVEEALSNVIKHSQARRVCVECAQPLPGMFAVRVEDDGVGFDVQAVQRAGQSVGMRSMAARAERMGAAFTVESRPGATVVSVVLLLKQ